MEQSENIIRLLEMLDNPERFSDDEIRAAINHDQETKEFYRLMVDVKRAENLSVDSDTDEAWKRFEQREFGEAKTIKMPKTWLSRAAAILVGVLLTGGLSYAAIQHFVINKNTETEQVATDKPSEKKPVSSNVNNAETVVESTAPITFDNEPLEKILTTIAQHYDCQVVFVSKQPKKIRLFLQWNLDEPLETVIEKLNMFERFSVKRDGQKIVVE